jgi:hypothetical protein
VVIVEMAATAASGPTVPCATATSNSSVAAMRPLGWPRPMGRVGVIILDEVAAVSIIASRNMNANKGCHHAGRITTVTTSISPIVIADPQGALHSTFAR